MLVTVRAPQWSLVQAAPGGSAPDRPRKPYLSVGSTTPRPPRPPCRDPHSEGKLPERLGVPCPARGGREQGRACALFLGEAPARCSGRFTGDLWAGCLTADRGDAAGGNTDRSKCLQKSGPKSPKWGPVLLEAAALATDPEHPTLETASRDPAPLHPALSHCQGLNAVPGPVHGEARTPGVTACGHGAFGEIKVK